MIIIYNYHWFHCGMWDGRRFACDIMWLLDQKHVMVWFMISSDEYRYQWHTPQEWITIPLLNLSWLFVPSSKLMTQYFFFFCNAKVKVPVPYQALWAHKHDIDLTMIPILTFWELFFHLRTADYHNKPIFAPGFSWSAADRGHTARPKTFLAVFVPQIQRQSWKLSRCVSISGQTL